jgi:translocation and assembly module TamB
MKQPLRVQATLDNADASAWDAGGLPLRRLVLQASGSMQQPGQIMLDRFELTAGDAEGAAGQITGQGRWQDDTLDVELRLTGLLPARLHGAAAALRLDGPMKLGVGGWGSESGPRWSVDGTLGGQALDGSGLPVQLRLVADGHARQLRIAQAEAHAGSASATATLQADAAPGGWRLKGQARLTQFDPRPWWRGAAGSAWRLGPHRMDAALDLDLLWRGALAVPAGKRPDRWLKAVDGDLRFRLDPSVLAGVPASGLLSLHSVGRSLALEADAQLAGNHLALQGRYDPDATDDKLQAELQAPALAALAPLGRLLAESAPGAAAWWPVAGEVHGKLSAQGRWPVWRSQGDLRVDALKSAQAALQSASLSWRSGNGLDAPVQFDLRAQGLASGAQRLDSLVGQLQGSWRDHALTLSVDSPAKPPTWSENLLGATGSGSRLQASGRAGWLPDATGGRWQLRGLQLQAGARDAPAGTLAWAVAQNLSAELRLDAGLQPQALTLAPGRVQLLSTALTWREARWQAEAGTAGRLNLDAELERFDLTALLHRLQPGMGWGGQLMLGGQIAIRSAERFDADIVLERLSGDLTITDDLGAIQALGITDLRLALTAHNGLWQFAQGVAGSSIGQMAGAQVLRTGADRRWPPAAAPLQGVLEANVANLGIWGAWVPAGWRLAGKLRTSASFSGTLGAPEVRGTVAGSGLGVRNLLQGVNLSDGELAITLAGDQARIDRLVFKGGEGKLTLTGGATLGAEPVATVHLAAERFRVLSRIDRRLVASGSADLRLDAQKLQLDGSFAVDEGLFDLSRGDAPALDGDVVVLREPGAGPASAPAPAHMAAAAPAQQRPVQVALKIDLGNKLRLRGQGVDTGLRGTLQVSSPDGRLEVHGVLRTEGGSFAAYGQKLEIDRGEIQFNGPLDNPRLDVLAIRPNLDVRVGVSVVGTAQNPRIRLFSEPELADYDKLSWLVLGRSPDGLGRTDTALLQRAAFALLAGDGQNPSDALLGAIGLTDFSVRQSDDDTRETIVSLGKQLSRRWYLGYERSVNATTGTWQLIYRVAQRFTLRAQSGSENALDVIWSWRW